MKTSARPCCCARLDRAVQISSSPFSKGIVLRTAPPASIGALVGKRIRWSGKCPKNISAKYTIPATRNFQAVGKILGFTSLQRLTVPISRYDFRGFSRLWWAKDAWDAWSLLLRFRQEARHDCE